MVRKVRKYPAKLLLFGEHTVLKGSSSLAIPFEKYFMVWTDLKNEHPSWLSEYTSYLVDQCGDFVNVDLLKDYIARFTIEANIPIGYGLGSSGALTAAIYDSCVEKKEHDLISLQAQLGRMESFFHGQSSGFDPLISFCNQPIQKTARVIKPLRMQDLSISLNCYLLDSGMPRSGKDMITKFGDYWELRREDMNQLVKANNDAINNILRIQKGSLDEIVKLISSLQLSSMDYMILPELLDLWKKGLESNQYYLKICGAGGGGYYLVFSKYDLERIGTYKLEKIYF